MTPTEKALARLRERCEAVAALDDGLPGYEPPHQAPLSAAEAVALLAVAEATAALLPCIQGSVAEDEVEALAAALASLAGGGGEGAVTLARSHQAHWQSCNCLSMTDKCCRPECPCHSLPEEVPDDRH